MGDIGQKPVAGGDQFLQPHRHLVEIMRQIGDLVPSAAHRGSQPGGEIAPGKTAEAGLHALDRLGQIPGQNGAEPQAADHHRQQNLHRDAEKAIV